MADIPEIRAINLKRFLNLQEQLAKLGWLTGGGALITRSVSLKTGFQQSVENAEYFIVNQQSVAKLRLSALSLAAEFRRVELGG